MRKTIGSFGIEPDHLHQLGGAGERLFLILTIGDRPRGNDAPDLFARIERRIRVLEDHLHASAHGAQFFALQMRHVLPAQQNAAALGVLQPHEAATDRRFA
ncbi:hypothetical protein D3C73_519470 [compost metagenome]